MSLIDFKTAKKEHFKLYPYQLFILQQLGRGLRTSIKQEKEMKTDYTGCHPEIAASLKKGEHIEVSITMHDRCLIGTDVIHAYCVNELYPYIGKEDDYNNESCSPIPKTETMVIGHVAMMQGLLDRRYKAEENGNWSGNSPVISKAIFSRCGKPPHNAHYLDWMLEAVEI